MKVIKERNKMPAGNGRFVASGGVFSANSGWVTSAFALVRAFVIPPPAAKPPGRYLKADSGSASAKSP